MLLLSVLRTDFSGIAPPLLADHRRHGLWTAGGARRRARLLLGGFALQIAPPVALVFLAPPLLFGGPSLPFGDPRGLGRLLLLFQSCGCLQRRGLWQLLME